ncbi:MAG: transcriptional regulator, AraC family [Paenibacillus sp.]|jgi:AraC-like DNA-binding protein|nr:transcriptional regulator, AraC family [Paenibacillus sp.]
MEETLNFQYDYLTRCMKKHTGKTPVQYLQYLRIERAKSLLENTLLSIQEVGERVGMGTIGYFHRVFHAATGMTPGQYRSFQVDSFDST